MSDPSEAQKHKEAHYDAAVGECKMLACVAGGFLALGTVALSFGSASEAIWMAAQGMMICSYIACSVIGGWSFVKYASLENPRPQQPLEPMSAGSAIGQLILGFILGVFAWVTAGLTLVVIFIVVVVCISERKRFGMLLAGTFLGALFPPLAIFIICGMR